MSANVLDKTHFDAVLTAALAMIRPGEQVYWFVASDSDNPNFLTRETASRVGAVLLAENVKSVNHRYSDDDPAPSYEFTRLRGNPTPVQLLGMLHGYEYQACEHPDWRNSEAYAIVRRLERLAMRRLPGYDDAPWTVSDSRTDVFTNPR